MSLLKSTLFDLLNSPLIIPLCLFALHYMNRWHTRRWPYRAVLSVLLIPLLLFSNSLVVEWYSKPLAHYLQENSAANADAIVVLGAGSDSNHALSTHSALRIATGTDLFLNQRAPLLVMTGAGSAHLKEENSTAKLMRIIARGKGIPTSKTQLIGAKNTHEEAVNTSAVLKPRGINDIILVTDKLHIVRATASFEHAGFNVIPHTSPKPDDYRDEDWFSWNHFRQFKYLSYEYIGLMYYYFKGWL